MLLLLCLQLGNLHGQISPQKKVVVIDPGHGGVDSGAIGSNGIKEKDVTLKIAQETVRLSRTLVNDRIDITLTRYRDTLISLSDRARLAKALKADLFISLHCNQAMDQKAKGIEIYVHEKRSEHSDKAIWLANSIQKELKEQLGFKGRGVKFGDFQVLREVTKACPAILVELGFLSNKKESDYLLRSHKIRALALAILLGLEKATLPQL